MKTAFDTTTTETLSADRLAYLERDRWPEFERELMKRRTRKTRFLLKQHYGARPFWAWMIWRCRKWEEIQKVLNRHKVDYRWKERRTVLELEGGQIDRCA